MRKRRAFPLYFGKHDDDLWNAINAIEEGDRNYQIRKALRSHFLGESSNAETVSPKQKEIKGKEEEVLKNVNIGLGLIR